AGSCAECAMPSRLNPPKCWMLSGVRCRLQPDRTRGATERLHRGVGLQGLKPCPRAPLDGRRDEPVQIEAMADQFEDPQLLLGRLAVGGATVASDRIGGFPQLCRKRGLDRLQCLLEPVLAADQIGAIVEHPRKLLPVEITENWEVANNVADNAQL